MAEILVRGEAEVRAMPDRAVLRVTVDGDGDTREAAYEAAARLAAAVDAVVEGGRDALDRVTTAALVVQPRTRWRKGETVRTGWRAARTSVVEVIDLGRLGSLVADLTAAGGAIAGPAWVLDVAHQAHDDARREAAVDARRRAEAYAAALGLRITGIGWVSEPGLRTVTPAYQTGVALAAAAAPAFRGAEDETIEITPEELTVRAVVEVGFDAS